MATLFEVFELVAAERGEVRVLVVKQAGAADQFLNVVRQAAVLFAERPSGAIPGSKRTRKFRHSGGRSGPGRGER